MPQYNNKNSNKKATSTMVRTPKKGNNGVLTRNVNKENEKTKTENIHKRYDEKESINDESDSTDSSSTEDSSDAESILSTTINEKLCEEVNKQTDEKTERNAEETKGEAKEEVKEDIKVNESLKSDIGITDNKTKEPIIEVTKQGRRLNIKLSNDVIYFNSRNKKYSFMSNFYPSKLFIDGKEYWHVEGYFQSKKFAGVNKAAEEHIRTALSPTLCKKIAHSYPLSEDRRKIWDEELKDKVMKRAVLSKFVADNNLAELLISTENAMLIEDNMNDDYWASGTGGRGLNKLGNILMNVRDVLIQMN